MAPSSDIDVARRAVLGLLGASAALTSFGANAWTLPPESLPQVQPDDFGVGVSAGSWQSSLLQKRRVLRLYNPRSKERAKVAFWDPEAGFLEEGYRQCCWMLRDVQAGVWTNMSVGLLNKLFGIQAWLDYYGIDPEMDLLSGLRTPRTNKATEGAAQQSRHLYGDAADVRLRRVGASVLGKMAQEFGPGGVGFYINSNFVHVDTGRTRTWRK